MATTATKDEEAMMEDSKFVDRRLLRVAAFSRPTSAHIFFSLSLSLPLYFSGGKGGSRAGNGYSKSGSAGPYKSVGRGGPRGGDYPQEGDRDFGSNYAMNDKLLMRDRAASIGSQGGGEGGAGRERSGSTTSRGAGDSTSYTPAPAAPAEASPPAP